MHIDDFGDYNRDAYLCYLKGGSWTPLGGGLSRCEVPSGAVGLTDANTEALVNACHAAGGAATVRRGIVDGKAYMGQCIDPAAVPSGTELFPGEITSQEVLRVDVNLIWAAERLADAVLSRDPQALDREMPIASQYVAQAALDTPPAGPGTIARPGPDTTIGEIFRSLGVTADDVYKVTGKQYDTAASAGSHGAPGDAVTTSATPVTTPDGIVPGSDLSPVPVVTHPQIPPIVWVAGLGVLALLLLRR